MEVFLVPVAPARYELYSEQADGGLAPESEAPQAGFLDRMRRSFNEMLLAATDRERAKREGRWEPPAGWLARQRDRLTAWVAQRVADQQLHWSLRQVEHVVLVHPADLPGDFAVSTVRTALQKDRRYHGIRAVVHGVLFVGSGLLAPVPGPNIVAYYFAFQAVGHYLSRRGAVQGLTRIHWTTRSSRALTDLAAVVGDPPEQRRARLDEIAARLELRDLAAFVERVGLGRA